MAKKHSVLPENWPAMTPAQRRQWRQARFIDPEGIAFVSPQAEQAYRIRSRRIVDAYSLAEPDRVPVMMPVGSLPYFLYGAGVHAAMYDVEKAVQACARFNQEHAEELDYFATPMLIPAPVFEILDYRLYTWPGHGLALDAPGFQYVEGEYMHADEYDDLIRDPTDFWLRIYLPRLFGAFEALGALQPLTNIIEIPTAQLMDLADPAVRQTLRRLIDAGEEMDKRARIIAAHGAFGPQNGFPMVMGSFAKAPFDTLGDTLRGTKGIMMDMFRQPARVMKAVEVLTEITIHSILSAAARRPLDRVVFPLHKGADGWMSRQQFDTFYWPSLKAVIDAVIEDGLTVILFAEGSYHSRLEYVNQFPKGSVCWWFDQTDMARAKALLGDRCCIQGNVPASLLVTGEPGDVKDYCRQLIETCAPGGGFILSAGCTPDNPKLENLQAMMAAVKEYGVYRRQ